MAETDLLGTVRRSPSGRKVAVLWPSPPHPARWMVADSWGAAGYETDEAVADWPVVGAVPFSPAAVAEESRAETPRLLTPSEVAAAFRVDSKTVTRWAAAGKLSSHRTPGGHRRYFAEEIEALLCRQGERS